MILLAIIGLSTLLYRLLLLVGCFWDFEVRV